MNEDADAIRDSARDFLSGADQRARVRALAAHTPPAGFDRDYWRQMADLGWLLLTVPEADGGLGLTLSEAALIAEEAGRALLPEPFAACGVLPIEVLRALPAGDRRDALMTQIGSGEVVATLAWQRHAEQLHMDPMHAAQMSRPVASNSGKGGADIASTSTVEERRDRTSAAHPAPSPPQHDAGVRATSTASGGMQLDGEVGFIVPGRGVDGWLVVAQSDAQAELVWVPADARGLTAAITARADDSTMAQLRFQAVDVAADHVIATGDTVPQAVNAALEATRLIVAAESIGVARHTLAATVDYVNTRQQFGQAIGSFQALQHRLVDALLQIELAAASLTDALQSWTSDGPAARRALLASRVKARANRAVREVTRLSIQLHGAIGYTAEYDIGLYFKRALHLSTWLGNADAHRHRYSQGLQTAAESAVAAPDDDVTPWTSADFPRDADWEAMPEPAFRGMLRAFFAAHYPERLRHMPWRLHWHEIASWYVTLSRQGWIAPSWPREHGGMALSPARQIAFIEEAERYGVARAPDQGLVMLGPILSRFGTPAQRAQFMPPILSGEHVWAQGYSEPNAGSDLAALRCEAIADGDDFIVTGQKTWSTLAQDATHMFMLVRTDKTVKKQAGISFLLVDLKQPGVTVRPIETLSGDAEFAEVFFDAVRVPRSQLVGELNGGWTIAKALLGFERLFSGSPKHSHYALGQVAALAAHRDRMRDPVFVDRLAGLQLDAADLSAMYGVFADIAKSGRPLPAEVSLLKIWASETHERIGALLIDMAEMEGGAHARSAYPDTQVHVQAPYLAALAATIFSGTNEVQRNILAKQVLGLAHQ